MKEKKRILLAYQEKLGEGHPDSIITKKKGKIANNISLNHARMRPSLDKWYQVSDLHLRNVIITVIKEFRIHFSIKDFSNIRLVSNGFENMVSKALYWQRFDFAPMHKPCLRYKQQNHIDHHCVEMASMAMIHFGLHPGKFICFLASEYTSHHQDVC
jgi:hypothetical protein